MSKPLTAQEYAEKVAMKVLETAEDMAKSQNRPMDETTDMMAAMTAVLANEIYYVMQAVASIEGTEVISSDSTPRYLH